MQKIFFLASSILFTSYLAAQKTLIPFGSVWKYMDNGFNLDTAWRTNAYNSSTWKSGPAELGYGDGDEATVVSYGSNAENKYITTYFLKNISIEDASLYSGYTLTIKRDDGAIVYFNGVEVFRTNMPSGTINYTTRAANSESDEVAKTPISVNIASRFLTTGMNTIAVEIHQITKGSTDISFNLQLVGIDKTPPQMISSERAMNTSEKTNASSLVYRISFSEKVTGVNASDFSLTTISGALSGFVSSVLPVDTTGLSYNVVVNNLTGNGTLRLDLKSTGTGIQDDAGNFLTSGYTGGQTYFIDQTAPRVVNIDRYFPVTSSSTSSSVLTYRVTFSELVLGVDATDFTVTTITGTATGVLTGSAITPVGSEGTTYDVSISAIEGAGTLRLDLKNNNTGINDEVLNPINGGFTSGEIYSVDQLPPAIVSINRQSPASEIVYSSTLTYRITFSESITGIDASDFTLTSEGVTGTLNASVLPIPETDGTTYDITINNVTGNGTLRLDLNKAGTGITDAAGNELTGDGFTTGQSYVVDQLPPAILTIIRQTPSAETTFESTLTYRITFTERVNGVDAMDFILTTTGTTGILNPNAVTMVGTDGTTYDVAVNTVTGNGTLRLDLKSTGTGIIDVAGNKIITGFNTGQVYSIDQTLPVITGIQRHSPANFITNAATLIYRLTFSEQVLGVDTSDFIFFKSGTATGIISSITGTGATYFITVTSVTGAGTLRLDLKIAKTGITDLSGNLIANGGYTLGKTFRIDRIVPKVISINRRTPSTSTTTDSTVTYRVTFSELVSGVDAADFIPTFTSTVNGRLTSSAVTSVNTDGTLYDVTISSVNGEGTLRLDLKENGTGIVDSLGNNISGGYTEGELYIIQQLNVNPGFTSISPLSPVTVSTQTIEKPQAKVWTYAGKWWTVLATLEGTKIYRLDSTTWTDVLTLSASTNSKADCRVIGNVVHILLFRGAINSFLFSVQYDSTLQTYKFWDERPSRVTLTLDAGVETATLAIDGNKRMWIASDDSSNIMVRWSDAPYSNWSAPIILATGISEDDISAVTPMPGKIGVLWSNQNTKLFGFKFHIDGADPTEWSVDEMPALQSSLNIGKGFADDHLNIAVANNGTLYCAAKTSYNTPAYPQVILLVRRPSGSWDNAYPVTIGTGTRPIVILNETTGKLKVIYTSLENGGDIMYREASVSDLVFSPPITMLNGGYLYNFTSSTHQNYNNEIVIVATNESMTPRQVVSVLAKDKTSGISIPTVVSINRKTPVTTTTNATDLIYRVTFSEAVTGVNVSDFKVTTTGNTTGTIASVTVVSNSIYDVAITSVRGEGTIRLDLLSGGTDIVNLNGVGMASGFTGGQTYIINQIIPPPPVILTRGPYLQNMNQLSVILRWRTDLPSDSRIEAGTVHGNYTISAINPEITTEHEVRITGLSPATGYYYRFGSSAQILQSGIDNYFKTAPPSSAIGKIRIAAFGDCGLSGPVQSKVLNSYLNYVGNKPSDLLLLLGDNAYNDGTDEEYQKKFFNAYSGTILKNHALFSTPGNHDYHTTSKSARTAPYYQNFTVPTAGECGGVASGTEAFYSYDWGNIHFVSMDSYGIEADSTRIYDTLGPQVTWLKKDLAANTKPWTIVYFHHPPFSKGTHNSDTEGELVRIRKNFVRILERYGVDLVMGGHSHNYERSYLLKGYYDVESAFNPGLHTVTTSSGKYDGSANSCPYKTVNGKINHGTVYVVAGSSSRSGAPVDASFPHDAMPFATVDGGMFYLEVEDNRLDGKFIHENGSVYDQFTILKDVGKSIPVISNTGTPLTLSASWPGEYKWSTGPTVKSIVVQPASSTSYIVTDNAGCVVDTFHITVPITMGVTGVNLQNTTMKTSIGTQILPTIVKKGTEIRITIIEKEMREAVLMDANGRVIRTQKFSGTTRLGTSNLASGTYFVMVKKKGKPDLQRVVVTD